MRRQRVHVRKRYTRQGVCRQVFAAVPRKAEAGRAGTLGIIEDCSARLFGRGLGKVAGVGEPKLKRGTARRVFAGRCFHSIACPQA
jgi:hypothetical protein